jgi:hypothetical protein
MTEYVMWFKELHINTQLMVLLTFLNMYDFLSTRMLINRVGVGIEKNPILVWAIGQTDTVWIILFIKIFAVGALWMLYDHVSSTGWLGIDGITRILIALNLIFVGIFLWNTHTLYRVFGTL